ncbi:50S ribosomal protein L4 [Blastococcus sp. TML/M2B]|uniref:50S ribosomal protein L4 n=1 Tax=Blastococcus sp. TML/M2B TaxID=2798727 RepID=UPI00281589BD|nr:50S ribosomal protein L4 [Blastococcus sp. TML/M2B]
MSQSIETRTDRQVDVRTPAGETSGSVTLPGALFDADANVSLMHQVVVAQLAAARQGTHSTKTRAQVSGTGAKPYRQKGTGRARQGSLRAPQFSGGGIAHGPVPRDYTKKTPKKMKAAALRGALSDRAREGRVHVVSAFVDGDAPNDQGRHGDAQRDHLGQEGPRRARPRRRPQLGEPAQPAAGAPHRGRPAEHL